jgi:hypothetical protein
MTTLPRRSVRRKMLKMNGFFKSKGQLGFNDWLKITSQTLTRGREYEQNNSDMRDKAISSSLEKAELNLIENWKLIGYDQQEIDKLREANAILAVKDLSTWREDKKLAIKLMREAKESLIQRMNG